MKKESVLRVDLIEIAPVGTKTVTGIVLNTSDLVAMLELASDMLLPDDIEQMFVVLNAAKAKLED